MLEKIFGTTAVQQWDLCYKPSRAGDQAAGMFRLLRNKGNIKPRKIN